MIAQHARAPAWLLLVGLALACGDDGSTGGDTAPDDSGTETETSSSQGSDSGADAPDASTTADPDGTSSAGTTGADDTSTGTSSSGAADASTTGASSTGGETGDPVVIAVGYGGLRVRSVDGGTTWQDETRIANNGGDDMALLRGAAWGEGRFVAVGWRIFSSPDGAQWTEHDNPTGQWYGAVAHGNDMFLAVGGGGYCARSDDGIEWESCTDATPGGGFVHVRSTLFHDGLFYSADANGVLRSSADGSEWTVVDADFGTPWVAVVDGQIVPGEQNAPAELEVGRFRNGQGQIFRADVGSNDFKSVYDIPGGNNVFQAYRFSFAQGFVEP